MNSDNLMPQYRETIVRLEKIVAALITLGFKDIDVSARTYDDVTLRDYVGKEAMFFLHDIAMERAGYEKGYRAALEELRLERNALYGKSLCVACDEMFPNDEFAENHKEHHDVALRVRNDIHRF